MPPHLRHHPAHPGGHLGEGVPDFLFNAFLQVARHDRSPLASPEGESAPPTESRIWVPPIASGRHLVGHVMPGGVDTKGRNRDHEPKMAHLPPSTNLSDTNEWERVTWVDQLASLSNFRDHVPGDVPIPDNQQSAPWMYMTLMYNIHYNLSTTYYHATTGHWVVQGTNSLLPAGYAPAPHNPGPDTYTREDEPDNPHIWGTWERRSLDTLLSIRSGNQGLGRAMYCLAKWTRPTWEIPADRWLWKVTLRPKQREAASNRRAPPSAPDHPTALPVHGGSPPHSAAVAGPRHPHPKLPQPHGGEHARHPAMLVQHPRLPPANTPTRPGGEMDAPWITDVPAQPGQCHHTATYISTSTGPHAGHQPKPAHTPGARTRTLISASDPTTSAATTISSATTTKSSSSTPAPKAAGTVSQTGPQTRPHREEPRRCQGLRPNKAHARSPAETQDGRQAATQTRRRTMSSTRSQTQAQAQAGHQKDSASRTPPGRPLRHPAPAIPEPAAAAPRTVPHHRRRHGCHHLHGEARRGRGATHLVPPPRKARS